MASRGDADVPGIEVIGVISDILPNFARFQASTNFCELSGQVSIVTFHTGLAAHCVS